MMETDLIKKCVREARELKAEQISFHITGESTQHPDLLEVMPKDYQILLSTNCLLLEGKLAYELSQMGNLLMILAPLWCEPEEKRLKSIANAEAYLKLGVKNRLVYVQMICSENSTPRAMEMFNQFSPYLNQIPQMYMLYKQPYTQEPDHPVMGVAPVGIPAIPRVLVPAMATPQSCGPDCMTFGYAGRPALIDLIVQSDGTIKPCFMRWCWGLGNVRTTTLREAWESPRRKEILKAWATKDPDRETACYDCLHMAAPSDGSAWWMKGPPPKNGPKWPFGPDGKRY